MGRSCGSWRCFQRTTRTHDRVKRARCTQAAVRASVVVGASLHALQPPLHGLLPCHAAGHHSALAGEFLSASAWAALRTSYRLQKQGACTDEGLRV